MRAILAAATVVAAAIAPAVAHAQTFSLQVWSCTANGYTELYKIGPGQFHYAVDDFGVWSLNQCERGVCTYANGQFSWTSDDIGTFDLNLNTGAFVELNIDGEVRGTCRVTG